MTGFETEKPKIKNLQFLLIHISKVRAEKI